MRESDRLTIELGTPSLVLMRRAAEGIRHAHSYSGKTAVVVGSGNNGGDGFALAEILAEEGKSVDVFTVTDHFTDDAEHYRERASALGVRVMPFAAYCLVGYDTIVDCLLGTGFKGEVRDRYRDAISEINGTKAFVISADINSGMSGDTGEYSLAVRSDLTVTIGYLKKGLVAASRKGDPALGRLNRADIGITLAREEDYLLTDDEWNAMGLPPSQQECCMDGHVYMR